MAGVILVVFLSLALWRAYRTRSPHGAWPFQLVRYGAVALNVVAAFLELNLEVSSRLYGLANHQSLWTRALEVAPLCALVVMLWERPSSSSLPTSDARLPRSPDR